MRKQSKRKDIMCIMCTFIQNLYIYTKIYFVDLVCESCFFSRRYYFKEAHLPMLCIDIPPTEEKKVKRFNKVTKDYETYRRRKIRNKMKDRLSGGPKDFLCEAPKDQRKFPKDSKISRNIHSESAREKAFHLLDEKLERRMTKIYLQKLFRKSCEAISKSIGIRGKNPSRNLRASHI